MRGEIKRLQKRLGMTALYVTHDQAEAMTMADLVAVMREGELQQLAPPDEIYDRPANRFVAAFVGDPPMNVLDGVMDAERPELPDRRQRLALGELSAAWRRPARRRSAGGRKTSNRPPGNAGNAGGEIYVWTRWATRRSSTSVSGTSA